MADLDEPGEQAPAVNAAEIAHRPLRHYDLVMAAFVTILLLSNVIGAGKVATLDLPGIGAWPFGAGILFFPVSYVIGDVLTEVYGYGRARRCIWAGFAALLFMAAMSWVVVALPPAASWHGQDAYQQVFGQVPRIVLASIAAFWAGEFVNSVVLAKMKLWTHGRHLWTRTIGSTVVGQAVDCAIFYPLAFWGVWDSATLLVVLLTQWALKVGWEALLTPVTYGQYGLALVIMTFGAQTLFNWIVVSSARLYQARRNDPKTVTVTGSAGARLVASVARLNITCRALDQVERQLIAGLVVVGPVDQAVAAQNDALRVRVIFANLLQN